MDIQIDDWQALVHKPVYSSDRKHVGTVSEISPEKIIVSYGPITPDKYIIPKSSVQEYQDGVVYIRETGSTVEHDYKFTS